MKKRVFLLSISVFLLVVGCRDNIIPIAPQEQILIDGGGGCSVYGIDVSFADTCSYGFALLFLSAFDSVNIEETYLGSEFYIYADAGNFEYWNNYFMNDLTVKYMFNQSIGQDSLILKFVLTGEKSIAEETERFNNIEHLQIIKIEKQDNHAFVAVPKDTEEDWTAKLMEYPFVRNVQVITVCTN